MSEIKKDIKYAKMSEIMDVVQYLLDNNTKVKITVTGGSMYPFLRDGIDSLLLERTIPHKLRKCDIVLFKRDNGVFVLHRISRVTSDGVYVIGDAQQKVEGIIKFNQIIAIASKIYRKDKCIRANRLDLYIMAYIWLLLKPFRQTIIRGYSFLKKYIFNHQHF